MLGIFGIISLFVLVNSCAVASPLEEKWASFKADYHKEYSSKVDEEKYFTAFKYNLLEIEKHNKLFGEGKVFYKKGVTKFADLTAEEFTEKYGLPVRPLKIYNDTIGATEETKGNKNVSEYLDWRKRGAVTKVKDQGTCGSCWIFSAIGALEGYYFRKTNKLLTFSDQQMVDCISNDTCEGGWSPVVFDYLTGNGKTINKEDDYPYKGSSGKCRYDKSSAIFVDFEKYVVIDDNENALMEAVTNQGPVMVTLYASDHWKLYKSGIWYEPACSWDTNHAVLLVGYGRENGQDYWILKNSWGKDWGEKGYMRFIRNKHEHYCGFPDYSFYII